MIILYPTDTSYALGCDARSKEDVDKIFEIKNRELCKTLPLIASDIKMVKEWFKLDGKSKEIAETYWPGPVTLILSVKKNGLTESVIRDGCSAVRVPYSYEARALSKEIGAPIVSTSANVSGSKNSYTIKSALDGIGKKSNKINRIIDVGELPQSKPSTIVQIKDNKIKILRQGEVCLKQNQ
jgi:L-threonylcarbamoyladenylate synthase